MFLSAGNYQIRDEESTGGRGFRQELPAHRRGIHLRKGDSTRIYQLKVFTLIQAGKIKMRGKSSER
jgi:hypothetical protein